MNNILALAVSAFLEKKDFYVTTGFVTDDIKSVTLIYQGVSITTNTWTKLFTWQELNKRELSELIRFLSRRSIRDGRKNRLKKVKVAA